MVPSWQSTSGYSALTCSVKAPTVHSRWQQTYHLFQLQDKLWQGLRAAGEQLQASTVAVWHLQRVVAKKRDPLSHVCFLDVLCGPGQPLPSERFW